MSFDPIRVIASRTAVLRAENIDTDQIIPARFLKTTGRAGLGRGMFHDWRFDAEGRPKNSSAFAGVDPAKQQVLVTGANFGCGSSREHAPWALLDYGFRAVVSSDIADIFKSNALKNGLLPVTVDPETHRWLLDHPGADVTIDLEALTITVTGGPSATFPVEAFARQCLLDGVDQLGALINYLPQIKDYEASGA